MVTWGLVQWFKYLQMKTHTHVQICSMVLFQNLYDLYADNHTHTLVPSGNLLHSYWKWWFIDIYSGFSH
jgi:hypothetical protein